MQNFLQRLARLIAREALIPAPGRILVALSGGADSVCLLDALHRLGHDILAVHCNFHLRGDESDRDMHFVQDLCATLGIDLRVIQFDVHAYCRDHGVSLEMACRDLRYRVFVDIARDNGCPCIAVAHQADDNVETLMLNLLRGTGITGLAAMPYINYTYSPDIPVVRPLLDFTRGDILDYLRAAGLQYVTDSTNLESEFRRNRLRNIILPLLEENFPGARDAILRTIANLRGNLALYRHAVDRADALYRRPDGTIDLAAIAAQGPAAPTILFELLRPMGFNASQCTDILRDTLHSGSLFTSATGITLNLSHGTLIPLTSNPLTSNPLTITRPFTFGGIDITPEVITRDNFAPHRDPSVIYLGASALSPDNRWQARMWQRGDRIQPFGMGGRSTLVSDILRDAHCDETRKARTVVITCNDRIIWIPGLKTSIHFPVTPVDTTILKLTAR